MNKTIKPHKLTGTFTISGDKSISHRAVMFGALAEGTTVIRNFLQAADCLSTLSCFRDLGVQHEWIGEELHIHGVGLHGLKEPQDVLNAGNSGTTMRLMSGILAGQSFLSIITGDASLRSRPMKRIVEPLVAMGAHFHTRLGAFAPLVIQGGNLQGGKFTLPVASAQLKSAILLAGLYAEGETEVIEPSSSRDHTERMLHAFGASIYSEGVVSRITPPQKLTSQVIDVPGDISSAAFLIVAGLIAGKEKLTIKAVGTNPSRTGILDVISAMGGNISCVNHRIEGGEPVADIEVMPSELHGTEIAGSLIPRLIDEIPVLAVAAAFATGDTIIRDAAELRIKESDRLSAVSEELGKFGVSITEFADGLKIKGGSKLTGAVIDPRHDHRIAMAMAIAGLASTGETTITNAECVNISFPTFWDILR